MSDSTRQNGGCVTVSAVELDQVALDAVFQLLDASCELAVGEVLVAVVDRLELAAVDGDDAIGKQLHPAAQQHELLADLADGLAVVAAEVCDRLEVRRPAPGQPNQLKIALRFCLEASARLDPVEVAVDVDLQQRRWAVRRATRQGRLGMVEADLPEITFINEDIDDTDRAVLVDPVVKSIREENALRSIMKCRGRPPRTQDIA